METTTQRRRKSDKAHMSTPCIIIVTITCVLFIASVLGVPFYNDYFHRDVHLDISSGFLVLGAFFFGILCREFLPFNWLENVSALLPWGKKGE